jgi:hypothetical protein
MIRTTARTTARVFWISVLILVVGCTSTPPAKRIIEFGWDEPTTAFMKQHISQMEQMPFDGTVYHLQYLKPDGSLGSFMNDCWGTQEFSAAQLQNAVDDLDKTPFKSLRHNFLRFNILPGNVDWFDDYSAVLNNATQAARIAARSATDGILFDTEQYKYPLFTYPRQRDAKTKNWDEYGKQVTLRGRQLMEAFQKGWAQGLAEQKHFPLFNSPHRPLVIMLTFSVSYPYEIMQQDKIARLADSPYGLLAPFMSGMYKSADGDDRIVDGCEMSYGFKSADEFTALRKDVMEEAPSLIGKLPAYSQRTRVAFPIWLDFGWSETPFYTDDLSKNYYPPSGFEQSLRAAMSSADDYVWIYAEKPRWWTEQGASKDLPKEYADAIRRVRARPTTKPN